MTHWVTTAAMPPGSMVETTPAIEPEPPPPVVASPFQVETVGYTTSSEDERW